MKQETYEYIQELLSFYVKEVVEAFIAITIVMYYLKDKKDRKFSLINNLKLSCFVGALIVALQQYDNTMQKYVKQGLCVSVGSILLKSA